MSDKLVLKESTVEVTTRNTSNLSVGDILYHNDDLYIVTGFEMYKDEYLHTNYRSLTSGREGSLGEIDLKNYYSVAKGITEEELNTISDQIIDGSFDISTLNVETPSESSSGLMVVDSSLYEKALKETEKAAAKVDAIKIMIRNKTEVMRRKLDGIIAVQRKMIKRLNSIVFTLELYAGINESVKQIQEGQNADDSEPIYLNQLMKYMDEEVGDPDHGGISFDSIDKFYDWLLSYNKFLKIYNYELVLPQKKCVRIMRVRRNVSERYSYDTWNNQWEISKEMKTNILIRNGENIYSIESKMAFSDKLYPDEKELTEIFKKDEDDKYDALERYKNGMVLMQGLIDRTTVFGNLYGKVSLLNTKSQEKGDVVFQYEMDDNLITDGSETFLDFLRNDSIEIGDRILLINAGTGGRYGHRLFRYYANEWNVPSGPEDGIYKVEKHKEKSEKYPNGKPIILYNPGGTVYSGWGYESNERKNRLSYKIYPGEDSNMMNFDSVSHRNIDWITNMMYDRRDRRKYLRAHGMLKAVKKFKTEEMELEKPFCMMLQSDCNLTELEALDLMHWWKTKNKHKRPISLDDNKALRMIRKEVKKRDLQF